MNSHKKLFMELLMKDFHMMKAIENCQDPAEVQKIRKDYSSSIDREQLRHIKYETTPEQRMNWLVDAGKFVMESRRNWKKGALPKEREE